MIRLVTDSPRRAGESSSWFLAITALILLLIGGPSYAAPSTSDPWNRAETCRLDAGEPVRWDCRLETSHPAAPQRAPIGLSEIPSWNALTEDIDASANAGAKPKTGSGSGKKEKKPWIAPGWLAGKPNKWTWTATGLILGGWAALAADGDVETIESVGDNTQVLPFALGLGLSLGARDWKGTARLFYSGLMTGGIVHLSKAVNEKYRPDATNTQSFPSGHTAFSFAGAGYIQQRYGPKWGIPALAVASYTAYSRVEAQKHFADDVISGMSIALFSNFLLVRPADPDRAAWDMDMERVRPFRFEWENADGNVSRNDLQFPAEAGTPIDFQFNEVADPQITNSIAFDYRVKKRHNFRFRYTPFEIRDVGTFTEDTTVGDRVIPAGTQVFSIYFLGDLRARYAYTFFPESRFNLDIGGGAAYADSQFELFEAMFGGDDDGVDVNEDSGVGAEARTFLPVLYVRLGVDLTKRFSLYAEVDALDLSDDEYYDAVAKFVWKVNPRWDLALGWRTVRSNLETGSLRNEFERSGGLIHVGYSF